MIVAVKVIVQMTAKMDLRPVIVIQAHTMTGREDTNRRMNGGTKFAREQSGSARIFNSEVVMVNKITARRIGQIKRQIIAVPHIRRRSVVLIDSSQINTDQGRPTVLLQHLKKA
jgi:hypothetical protein